METFDHELHSQMGIACPPAQYGPGLYHCSVHRGGSNIVAVLGEHTARWGEQVGQQMTKCSVVSPVVKGPLWLSGPPSCAHCILPPLAEAASCS